MNTPANRDLATDSRYREIWSVAAEQVLRKLTHELSWHAVPADGSAPEPLAADILAQFQFSKAVTGCQCVALSRESAQRWGHLLGGAAPDAEAAVDPAAGSQALIEVLQQIAVAVTTGMKAAGWGETQIIVNLATETPAPRDGVWLRFQSSRGEAFELGLERDPILIAAQAERRKTRAGAPPPSKTGVEAKPGAGDWAAAADKMGLLFGVELDATLRFGGRRMLLRDILELGPGSVVELDREINEPVELLVGGRPVAWGEAVVVDGNYGFRVTRLANPQERMAAMRGAR